MSEKYKSIRTVRYKSSVHFFRAMETFQCCETEQGLAFIKKNIMVPSKSLLWNTNGRKSLPKQATPLLTGIFSQKKKAWSPKTATEPLLF